MEDDAVGFMDGLDETADLGPHHTLEWQVVRRHHVHCDAAHAERRRDFEPDEACTDHHSMFPALREVDDGTAVGKRSEVVHLRRLMTGNGKPHGIGAGGNQQAAELAPGSVVEKYGMCGRID